MTSRGSQHAQSFTRQITHTVGAHYLLYLPAGYTPDGGRRWPLILFLHGRGERGASLSLLKTQGLPRLLEQRADFPFIVVSPQLPRDEMWWSPPMLGALLDEIAETQAIDPDRVYVTGLSMGGFGTWALALAYPQRFAAIAPICGGGSAERIAAIAHLPVWAFHGAKDDVVPLAMSEEMTEALRKSGGTVRLTIYLEARHDSWTQTYANPELYTWFLSHSRGGSPDADV